MADDTAQPTGPDLRSGVDVDSLAENSPFLGHVDGEAVMLVRQGENIFATGAICTHYSGPLAEGLVVGETIRCPWHHARFSLRTGEAEGAPALNPIPCFAVQCEDGKVRVDQKRDVDFKVACPRNPESVVIVGGGAAGAACADMLRNKGYGGPITLVGDEEPGPVDRPNLSKDYLAGTAPEDWIVLRSREHYESIHVEMILGDPAVRIDPEAGEASLRSGRVLRYGALLLATGAGLVCFQSKAPDYHTCDGYELWLTLKRSSQIPNEPSGASWLVPVSSVLKWQLHSAIEASKSQSLGPIPFPWRESWARSSADGYRISTSKMVFVFDWA